MNKFMELVSNIRNVALLITALAGAAGTVFGMQSYLDATYASTEQVEKLEKRLTLQELKELLKEALDEMFFWRKQERKYPGDEEIKEKLKESQEYVDELRKRIKGVK